VNSTCPISIIGIDYSLMSSDAFVVRPVSQLGTQYMVVTSILRSDLVGVVGPFVIAIVATADNTQITVQCSSQSASLTLSSGALTCSKGGTMTLTLNQYQTAQVSKVINTSDPRISLCVILLFFATFSCWFEIC
jgi:hypothetical protein